jgi:type IV secretory pathway protease TraF
MIVKNSSNLYRSNFDSSTPCGILINKDNKRELKRRVTFSRVVILNKPSTFILVKEERGLIRRLSERLLK